MNGYNENISDKELRELLRIRLLQEGGDDPLTDKLIDMEAQIAFGLEPQLIPSPQREAEIQGKGSMLKPWMKWFIPSLLVAVVSVVLVLSGNNDQPEHQASKAIPVIDQAEKAPTLPQKEDSITQPTEQAPAPARIASARKDSSFTEPFIQHKEHLSSPAHSRSKMPPLDDEQHSEHYIPSLSQKQIEENNKHKEKMLKQLIKKDSRQWLLIPMGSEVYKGDTVSVQSFYISATEVSNKQYRTFLYDLLIKGRVEDYIKAVPDTMQWSKLHRYYEPHATHYHSHTSYDNYPAVNISREAAEMYMVWLTNEAYNKMQKDYGGKSKPLYQVQDLRLPYDIEWAVAARGGARAMSYPWGGPDIQNARGCYLANFNIQKTTCKLKPLLECKPEVAQVTIDPPVTSAGVYLGGAQVTTARVDSYNPNKYGVYNLSGNAAEMVWVFNKANPGEKRAGTKGGSWNSDCEHLKIEADDEYEGITQASPFIGFRPIMTFVANGMDGQPKR